MDPEDDIDSSPEFSSEVRESPSESPDRGMDMRAAFEEASRLSGGEERSTADSKEAEASAPDAEPEAPAEPASAATPRTFTEQSAFDRALTLHRQGRTHELPPEVQGQIRKWETEVLERKAQEDREESQFLEMYVSYLAMKEEDPEGYIALLDSADGDDIRLFMRSFAQHHPEVSLDNPRFTPREKTPDEIRAEVGVEMADRLQTSLRALADDYGVQNFDQLLAASRGQGTLLVSVMNEAIKVGTEKAIEKVRKEEREAARLEAMKEYGARMPELSVSGNARSARPSNEPPKTMREAFLMAEALQR